MKTPELKTFVAGTACVMVAIPLTFLAVYPLVCMMLPDYFAIRADLPRDLTILVIADAVVVPLVAGWLYVRARGRAATGSKLSVPENTRDVY